MQTTRLGRTNLTVTRTGFGALPIQRCGIEESARILRAAYNSGITFFDTARGYSDSETKIGYALSDVRSSIIIATKSGARNRAGVLADLEKSLSELRTDYVDLIQLHNPSDIQNPDDPESAYAGIAEAKDKGMTRFIGITNHARDKAIAAIESGLYDTLQYPLCHISSPEDLALIDLCRAADMGVIAMKPLSGGLITKLAPAFAYLRQYENVIPIWGIQKMSELEELIEMDANPPSLDEAMWSVIENDRCELAGDFCRGCGYCLPCPQQIPINMAARMTLLLKRAPWQGFMTDDWYEKMHRIDNCTECGDCRARCPYGLNPPEILAKALQEYDEFYRQHAGR